MQLAFSVALIAVLMGLGHNENMGFLRLAGFVVWSSLNVGVACALSGATFLWLSLRYDEMHTASTALDPDPHLMRQTVIFNVMGQSASSLALVVIFAVIFWCLNHTIYPVGSLLRRGGVWVACLCTFVLLLGVAAADYYCLSKYPQRP